MQRWINAVAVLLCAVAILFGLTLWVSEGVGWLLNDGSTGLFIGGLITTTVWTLCITVALLWVVAELLEYLGFIKEQK